MKYHVVTPFSRFQNYVPLREMLRPHAVMWHLLMDDPPTNIPSPHEDWIEHRYFPPAQPFWRAWANHLNRFIATCPITPTDRYVILNDDDFVEPEFFSKLDRHSGEMLVCSMARGQHTPPSGHKHPITALLTCPKNMRVGSVGCEQLICSGRIFSTLKFADDLCADGIAIVDLSKRAAIKYVPEAWVWFNYLEAGRWDK